MKKVISFPVWVMPEIGFLILNIERIIYMYYNAGYSIQKGVVMKRLLELIESSGGGLCRLRRRQRSS